MRNHIMTITLLFIAVIVFALRFFVAENHQDYCDIVAFALPMLAALMEIYLSEKNNSEAEKRIKELETNQLSIHVEGETLVIDKGVKIV